MAMLNNRMVINKHEDIMGISPTISDKVLLPA